MICFVSHHIAHFFLIFAVSGCWIRILCAECMSSVSTDPQSDEVSETRHACISLKHAKHLIKKVLGSWGYGQSAPT